MLQRMTRLELQPLLIPVQGKTPMPPPPSYPETVFAMCLARH